MTFGIWQDFYSQQQVVRGAGSATGVIGTTMFVQLGCTHYSPQR